MEIFKFGGASVKDAEGVRNFVAMVQKLHQGPLVIVISAMGKMTNAFEAIVKAHQDKSTDPEPLLQEAQAFHLGIIEALNFGDPSEVVDFVASTFDEIAVFFKTNTIDDYDFVYDQVVSKAEFLSTRICSALLQARGTDHQWLDVRKCIKTNSDFRRARVDWEATQKAIQHQVDRSGITLTQGFIGSDQKGRTTTLGREGSDYTAGIFAHCLDAHQVSIFKDVPGVLNADPREFEQTTLIEQISYKEAIEMAFYGASVIHPKTLQPLQRKGIPLRVRSFKNAALAGTFVGGKLDIIPFIPCYIVKKQQILISISDREFHFVMEEDISEIFKLLHQYKIKVNLIQNSAISFSLCVEDNFNNFERLMKKLTPKYKVKYNENLILYTIRHFNEEAMNLLEQDKEILLKQRSRETVQIIVKA